MINSIITARILGPELVGILALLVTLKELTFRFAHLGLGTSLKFYVAKKQITKVDALRYAIRYGAIISIVLAFFINLFWDTKFSIWNDLPSEYIWLYTAVIMLFVFINFFQHILQGTLEIRKINQSDLIMFISQLVGIVLLVWVFRLGIMGAIYSTLISHTLVFLFLLFQMEFPLYFRSVLFNREAGIHTDFDQRKLFSFGSWSYFNMILNIINTKAPIFFLKYYSTNTAIGLFSKAEGIQGKSNLLVAPFQQILFSYTASSKIESRVNRTNTLTRLYAVFMIFVSVAGVLLGKWLILLLYGPEFSGSVPIFYALAPTIVFLPLNRIIGAHISGAGYIKERFYLTLLIFPIFIGMVWYFIRLYEGVGAGMAISISNLLLLILYLIFYTRKEKTTLREVLLLKRSDFNLVLQKLRKR